MVGTFAVIMWTESWTPVLARWVISSALALILGAGLYFASEYAEHRWRETPTPPPSSEREEKERPRA